MPNLGVNIDCNSMTLNLEYRLFDREQITRWPLSDSGDDSLAIHFAGDVGFLCTAMARSNVSTWDVASRMPEEQILDDTNETSTKRCSLSS